MPRTAHERQRIEAGDAPSRLAPGRLVSRLLPSAPSHKPQTILDDLAEAIRALIAHLDKSHDWQHVVPGANRPWKGQFDLPSLRRDGSLPVDKQVMAVVWDSSIVATCRVNNAIVPVVGAPVLEVKLNQVGVLRPDGSTDIWISKGWTRSPLTNVCYRVEWTLKDFHERDVKVVFVTAARNVGGDRPLPEPATIRTIESTESLNQVPTASRPRPTRHPRSAGAPPPRRPSSSSSSLDGDSDSDVDHLGGGVRHDHVFDPLRSHMSSYSSLAVNDPPSSSSSTTRLNQHKSRPVMTAAELTAHAANRPGVPSMRPVAPRYANLDADQSLPPPHYPPTVSDTTLRRVEDAIKGFLRHTDDPRAPTFRGVSSSRNQVVHVGDFTLNFGRDERGKGAWVLEVLVHLKGCWTLIRPEVEREHEIKYPFNSLQTFAYCLPGGNLDPRHEHTVECTVSASRSGQATRLARRHSPDLWTFVSRSGSEAGDLHTATAPHTECHRVVATKWNLRSGVKASKDDSLAQVPPVHVTFALDEPFEVRSRSRKDGRVVQVFSQGHGEATARRREEGHEREGRVFE
ncbi:hypothetical protein JCM9279_003926 [Rhodotorula babjevae]